MKECLNCLNSTPGHCGLHAPKIEMVGYTCTTSTSRKYSKSEVEKEVKKYEEYPAQDKEDIFKYTFAEMPYQVKEQFEEYKHG